MPGWPIRKNESGTLPVLVFPIYDADGDLVTGAAALDSERSIDQGVFSDCAAEAAEIATASGMYSLAPTQAELNGDEVAFITKTSTGGAKTAVNVIYTSTRNIDDLAYPTVSGRSVDVAATGEVGLDLDNTVGDLATADFEADFLTNALLADNVIAAEQLATDAITAAKIAANAIGAAEIADAAIDAATFAVGAIDASAIAADAIGASEIAAGAITVSEAPNLDAAVSSRSSHSQTDVWDVDATGRQTQGTFGQAIGDPILDADTIFGMLTDLEDGTTTLDVNVASIDANAITAAAIANAAIDAATFAAGAIDASAIAADAIGASEIAANAIGSSEIATGAIDADAIAADAITAAKIATDAIGADEIAASGANEIADATLSRDVDQVEGAAALHSLCTAILKAVSRIRDNAGTLEIYRTDGLTLHMSQTVTIDATLDPIDELTVGV